MKCRKLPTAYTIFSSSLFSLKFNERKSIFSVDCVTHLSLVIFHQCYYSTLSFDRLPIPVLIYACFIFPWFFLCEVYLQNTETATLWEKAELASKRSASQLFLSNTAKKKFHFLPFDVVRRDTLAYRDCCKRSSSNNVRNSVSSLSLIQLGFAELFPFSSLVFVTRQFSFGPPTFF